MENPDIYQALLYIFAAAALGGILVWLILRLQLKDLKAQLFQQSDLLEESQARLKKSQEDLKESKAALAAQSAKYHNIDEQRASWQAAEKIHAAEKRALNEWKAKAEKTELELKKTRLALSNQSPTVDNSQLQEWQARYEKAEKARQELQTEMTEAARREAKWHDEVLALQGQIQRLQAQNSATTQAPPAVETPTPPAHSDNGAPSIQEVLQPKERSKEAITLARIKERAKSLNFDRIGYSRPEQADDLKRIKGIGPFLEKKLNSIGIYSFFQLANFESEDEDKVNEAIEFFPGRIKRDHWVSQAKEMLKQNDKK